MFDNLKLTQETERFPNGRPRLILPRPGKWSHAAGRYLIWDRLYNTKTKKPTILCTVRLRYQQRG